MVKWIIQKNLVKPEILEQFQNAFEELNIEFEEVTVIPFSNELPAFTPKEINIFYGSTTLMINAYKAKEFRNGVFFDPSSFNVNNYIANWRNRMLNFDGKVLKFKDFIPSLVDSKSSWFIRPNDDTKSFAGTVMSSKEIKDWYYRISKLNETDLNPNTLIVVSEEKSINKEWRNFIVDGKIIDSSRYILNGKLNISNEDIPTEMIEFVEKSCSIYSPHRIFVLDIAETDKEYKIIESNCFNGTGFYNHNIKKIIKNITLKIKTQPNIS